jgi:branched-chain amino acid transport system substrate-binding protein
VRSRQKLVGLIAATAAVVIGVAGCGGSSKSSGSSSSGGASSSAAKTATFSDPTSGVTTTSINYGLISDQTGATVSTQVPFADGFKSAINAVNAKGGILGRKINVDACDEQYQVAPAVACLKDMISNTPVVGLTGLNNSSFQAAGLPLVQAAKLPVIGPESTSKEIVTPFPGYVWATECTYPNQADVAVAWAAKELGTTNFTAIGLGGNVQSAADYLNQVKERVQKIGATYQETVQYTYGAPNMDQQAQEIASKKPMVIFTHGGTAQNVTAFKSLEKFGVTNTLTIGIFAQETDAIAQASPAVGKNYFAVNCYQNGKNTTVKGVPAMVAAGQAAGYAAAIYNDSDFTNGYVNGLLVIDAITKAGDKLTRASLNAAMPTITNFDTGGLSPNITFGPSNSVGVNAVAPFKYNYTSGVWEIQGTFDSYTACNSNEFQNGNIDKFSASCIKS